MSVWPSILSIMLEEKASCKYEAVAEQGAMDSARHLARTRYLVIHSLARPGTAGVAGLHTSCHLRSTALGKVS